MLLLIVFASLVCGAPIQAIGPILFSHPLSIMQYDCRYDSAWTAWFNSMKPSSAAKFDQDSYAMIQERNGTGLCLVPRGIQIEALPPFPPKAVLFYDWQIKEGVAYGFKAKTADIDYQVRFCCPKTDFPVSKATPQTSTSAPKVTTQSTTTTTTAKTTPAFTIPPAISLSSCGRADIKASLQTSRIFGGSKAVPSSWPWQILFRESTPCDYDDLCTVTCGGTLIDAQHVLTAAHCISTKNASMISMIGGVHDQYLAETGTRQSRSVERIFLHPGWNRQLLINDIAILRLSEPMQFTRFVQPACLSGPDPTVNSTVVVIGWGNQWMGGETHPQLKQAHMRVVGDCTRFWPQVSDAKQICVASRANGDSVCQGDSGGPMLQQFDGQWFVQGVTSFVGDCQTSGNLHPNVFVRVSAYLDWIRSIIFLKA